MGIMRSVLTIIVLTLVSCAYGQDALFESAYRNAKELYRLGKYELALEEFSKVTEKAAGNPYYEYASFYYALAAYHSGSPSLAKNMLLQIETKYPGWKGMDEAYFWRCKILWEQEQYKDGIELLDKIKNPGIREEAMEMKAHFISGIDSLEILMDLYDAYPEDRSIGITLANVINQQPLIYKDFALLELLVAKYGLPSENYGVTSEKDNVFKDSYRIGVMLPFMYDNLQPYRGRRSNSFILDIYEGMKMGVEKLKEEEINIEVFAYDTRRDSATTTGILANDEMRSMDLIVGPLFPGPIELANQFSYENRINMINPLSSNSKIIDRNPYAFLYNPITETLAEAAANYALDSLRENKYAMILYGESTQDSVMAYTYKELIERDSFEVVYLHKVFKDSINQLYDSLTAIYDLEDPDEIVLMNLNKDEEELEEEEDIFVMAPDSIGHIFVASGEEVIASTVISAVEARPDTILIIGEYSWLDHHYTDFNVLEKIGVIMLADNYFKTGSYIYEEFKEYYLKDHRVYPSRNSIIAYDMTLFLGRSLNKYGKYFQGGLRTEGYEMMNLKTGYDYSRGNYNHHVPIVRVRENKVEIIR